MRDKVSHPYKTTGKINLIKSQVLKLNIKYDSRKQRTEVMQGERMHNITPLLP
jgi:hypothetical protein